MINRLKKLFMDKKERSHVPCSLLHYQLRKTKLVNNSMSIIYNNKSLDRKHIFLETLIMDKNYIKKPSSFTHSKSTYWVITIT